MSIDVGSSQLVEDDIGEESCGPRLLNAAAGVADDAGSGRCHPRQPTGRHASLRGDRKLRAIHVPAGFDARNFRRVGMHERALQIGCEIGYRHSV
jgi:hypothetical protein